jgi:hypothetical protein
MDEAAPPYQGEETMDRLDLSRSAPDAFERSARVHLARLFTPPGCVDVASVSRLTVVAPGEPIASTAAIMPLTCARGVGDGAAARREAWAPRLRGADRSTGR